MYVLWPGALISSALAEDGILVFTFIFMQMRITVDVTTY